MYAYIIYFVFIQCTIKYIEYNKISWYRKHFTLDPSYKGSTIWIDFDGVYRDSQMWINGVFLGVHTSGYTSFRYTIFQ